MEKRCYSIESLEEELRAFEDRYGFSSEEVSRADAAGDRPAGVPGFDVMVWADAYCEVERLRARQPHQVA